MLSAFGPVTTILLFGDSGRVLFWLRSSVIDSRAARNVAVRPAVTAASAVLEFQREYPLDRLVDPGHGDGVGRHILLDRGLPLFSVEGQHGHVNARVDGESGRSGQV